MIDRTIKIPFDVLTPAVKEVAEICDLDTALSVVAHFGGCRFYVPTKWHPEHELNIIGEDRAKILIERMGGGELSISKSAFSTAGLRYMVKMLSCKGWKQRDIARALDCTMKTVRNIHQSNRCPAVTIKGRPVFLNNPNQLDIEDYLDKNTYDGHVARDAFKLKRK